MCGNLPIEISTNIALVGLEPKFELVIKVGLLRA
jgi:hypothetical protein